MKHRTLAAAIVTAGKVRLNHARLEKTSHLVKPGDVLTLTLFETIRVVRVLSCAERRGSAADAYLLYEEVKMPLAPSFAHEKTGA